MGKILKLYLNVFDILFDDSTIKIMSTNICIDKIKNSLTRERHSNYSDEIEIRAFVGIR